MEFWGVEVPSGKPLTCKPGADSYVHVSQAALGDAKTLKGNDRVVLKVKVGSNEVVVGTLSQGKCDQTTLDLIFEKDFVLSHNSSGSVFFCGYKTDAVRDDVSGSSDEEDDEFDVSEDDVEEGAPELVQLAAKENGKVKAGKVEALVNKAQGKSASKAEVAAETKPKSKAVIPEDLIKVDTKKIQDKDDDTEDDDDEEDDDEDDDMLESDSNEEDLDSDDEGDSDDEDESEEEQPKVTGKKRALPFGTPGLQGKKSKTAVPGKLGSKSSPAPASTPKQQQSSKKEAPVKATPGKENAATPASGKKLGQYFCEPCKKNFNSESALSQHKTAKHK